MKMRGGSAFKTPTGFLSRTPTQFSAWATLGTGDGRRPFGEPSRAGVQGVDARTGALVAAGMPNQPRQRSVGRQPYERQRGRSSVRLLGPKSSGRGLSEMVE